jgi:hypothetical protein
METGRSLGSDTRPGAGGRRGGLLPAWGRFHRGRPAGCRGPEGVRPTPVPDGLASGNDGSPDGGVGRPFGQRCPRRFGSGPAARGGTPAFLLRAWRRRRNPKFQGPGIPTQHRSAVLRHSGNHLGRRVVRPNSHRSPGGSLPRGGPNRATGRALLPGRLLVRWQRGLRNGLSTRAARTDGGLPGHPRPRSAPPSLPPRLLEAGLLDGIRVQFALLAGGRPAPLRIAANCKRGLAQSPQPLPALPRPWSHPDQSVHSEADNAFDRTRIPEQFWRVLERHYEALGRYVPKPYPGRVTLFRARTRSLFGLHGSDLGWAKLACGGLDVRTIPGNHASILKEPYVGALAEALQEKLWQAQAAENSVWRARPVPALS